VLANPERILAAIKAAAVGSFTTLILANRRVSLRTPS
jgi:hypothetical protein